jgi:hypothetical protein
LILYKYYGYDAGLAALRSSQLGFRNPKDFNDPFELTFLSNAQGPNSKLSRLGYDIEELKSSIVILSLTRTPLNPLMWAHYGRDHEGFVIGYETNEKFLTSKDYNLITVDNGDVVYTNTKSPHVLNIASMKLFHDVYMAGKGLELNDTKRAQVESLMRKVFLTKHSVWVYEEEVRVVKANNSFFETTEATQADLLRSFYFLVKDVAPGYACDMVRGLHIYNYRVKIKEVYLGIRNPLLNTGRIDNLAHQSDMELVNKANEESWKVYALKMSPRSWGLKSIKVPIDTLAVRKRSEGLINSFEFSGKEASFLKNRIPAAAVSEKDKFELTNWNGRCHLKVNGRFIEK